MEEQILRFYLKVFSLFLLIIIYFFYILFIKNIVFKHDYISIEKKQNYYDIIDTNIIENKLNIFLFKNILKIILLIDTKIHFGKFLVNDNSKFIDFINIIKKPSNYFEKITIIEGSSKYDLNILLNKYFKKYQIPEYNKVIADTYYYNYGTDYKNFEIQINNNFNKIKNKFDNHPLLDKFTFEELLIIGSLLEKEGKGYLDKKKIYSVIVNRISRNMKLQIDATVIYALTDGNTQLLRKLTFNDLKIDHKYNTYHIYGLPPKPISYVGTKTIELIFENYKTNYLFYFYNDLKNKHVFSENYKEHLLKLNEYRSVK